jgi:hypothetical protein
MIERARRLVLAFAVAAIAGSLSYGDWRLLGIWRGRTALSDIQAEVQAGRHSKAARELVALMAWKPDSEEVAYLLGVCEKARGRTKATWGREWLSSPADHARFRNDCGAEVSCPRAIPDSDSARASRPRSIGSRSAGRRAGSIGSGT